MLLFSIPLKFNLLFHCVKHCEEASVYGIDEGRISKLTLKRSGEMVCNYDRGWDIEPDDENTAAVLAILMKDYN